MSAVGKKFTQNLNKLRKKLTDVPNELLPPDSDNQDSYLHLRSVGRYDLTCPDSMDGRAGEGAYHSGHLSQPPKQKSISMCSINKDEAGPIGQDDIISLTHDVKCFSDTLAKLKAVFTENNNVGEELRILAHERLGEVLNILKTVLQRYQALNSTDVFSASGTLITKIKSYRYEGPDEEEQRCLCDVIDKLALAFSSSVSDYLMGDTDGEYFETEVKTKSCDNLASIPVEMSGEINKSGGLTSEEVDEALLRMETGVDLSLHRAKAWSKYAKDVITYIDRKSQFESEYAKSLTRLAQGMKQTLTEEGFLPFQSVFCTSLAQDLDYGSTCQATCTLLQTQKFIEPLSGRRADHDKVRKYVKDTWLRERKRMHDAVTNLKKAKDMYIQRHHDYEKAKDLAQKTEAELLNQSGGTAISKVDKRRRLEEDALHRAAEAETTYKACVAEANMRQEEMAKVKREVLIRLREQILLSDEVMKKVTVDYFQLQNAVSAPLPVQYQTLCETSRGYEPGSQYAEFVRRLPITGTEHVNNEPFSFEPYLSERLLGERKTSNQSNGSCGSDHASHDSSPQTSPRKPQKEKGHQPLRAWGQGAVLGSDTDSGSSNQSVDNSPSASPRGVVCKNSMEHLAEKKEQDHLNDSGIDHIVDSQGRKLRVGRDGDFQGICKRLGTRRSTFGVDFNEQVKLSKRDVPPIITTCLLEIEKRGADVKGIYRVSGVKSKVEHLCHRFDNEPDDVDLTEENPNVLSNVLKLYLRQLPEPLLTFHLYPDFIRIAKEDMSGTVQSETTVQRLCGMVKRLPKSNFKTSAVLMHHLRRVANNVEVNQMSTNNLGIVFGPTLLRPKEGTASLTSLVDTPHQTRTVELLIVAAEAIFGPSEDYQLVPGQTPIQDMTATTTNNNNAAFAACRHSASEQVVTPHLTATRSASGPVAEAVFLDEEDGSSQPDKSHPHQEFTLPGSTHGSKVTEPHGSLSETGSEVISASRLMLKALHSLKRHSRRHQYKMAMLIEAAKVHKSEHPTLTQPSDHPKDKDCGSKVNGVKVHSPTKPNPLILPSSPPGLVKPLDSVQVLREKMKRDLGVTSQPPPPPSDTQTTPEDSPQRSPATLAKAVFLYGPPDSQNPLIPSVQPIPLKQSQSLTFIPSAATQTEKLENLSTEPPAAPITVGIRSSRPMSGSHLIMSTPKPYPGTVQVTLKPRDRSTGSATSSTGTGPLSSPRHPVSRVTNKVRQLEARMDKDGAATLAELCSSGVKTSTSIGASLVLPKTELSDTRTHRKSPVELDHSRSESRSVSQKPSGDQLTEEAQRFV